MKSKPPLSGREKAVAVAGWTIAAGCLIAAAVLWARHERAGSAPAAAVLSPPAASPPADAAAVRSCALKAPGPAVYVREAGPGAPAAILSTGGNWQWDYGTGRCLSAVAYAIANAVPMDGTCTTVAYASDNPGYDPGALPAPPLNDVIASAGPGC